MIRRNGYRYNINTTTTKNIRFPTLIYVSAYSEYTIRLIFSIKKEAIMIHRWSTMVPLFAWLLGTLTITPTSTSKSNVLVVMAFTPISPTTSTTYFSTAQHQKQLQFTSSVDTHKQQHVSSSASSSSSSTSLDSTATSMMSPWNINQEFGAPPFGFDTNAEIWNGRIAQVGFRLFD